MSHTPKTLIYVSLIALGFTASCAANSESQNLKPVSAPSAVTAAQPNKPTDITLDDGKSMLEKTGKTSENTTHTITASDKVEKNIENNIVITNKSEEKAAEAVPSDSAPEVKTPYEHRETIVGRKVMQLEKDLNKVTDFVTSYDERIGKLQSESETQASQYFGLVAAIQSRLQGGSTPGNPILVEQMQGAQKELDALASSVGELNKLSTEISSNASVASFLLESVRATYNLSGAVEEDHKKLTDIEDRLNGTIVRIDRQLNDLSDDVNRRASYLATERRNLQTLALAVANGEPYGQSLARKAYGPVSTLTGVTSPMSGNPGGAVSSRPQSNRPMIIIRFDRPKVDYQQAVYLAASEALEKYPDASFEVVAVTPARGNAAQRSLSSSDSRRNAEEVFRTLVDMGVPSARVKLAAAQSPSAATTEVHIFLR